MELFKKNKKTLLLSSILILLPAIMGLFLWNYLPNQMATHWDIYGNANGFSSKLFGILGIPFLLFIVQWICIFATSFDVKNKEQNPKVLKMVLSILPILSFIITGTTYAIALDKQISVDFVVRILFGVLFLIIGNYMPKCIQNHTIGIRITWTLRHEENWNKTHRFAGKIWVGFGVFCLATIFFPLGDLVYLFFLLMMIPIFAPMIYSYLYYRKELKAGRITKEQGMLTESEKKSSKIGSIIGISILLLAIAFIFTGKFEIEFTETSLEINALYWSDLSISYEDIEDLKIVVSEACTNVVQHAYNEDEEPGDIKIGFVIYENRLEIMVVDHGHSCNFDEIRKGIGRYEKGQEIQLMREGGLGLYLIETLMDEVIIHQDQGVTILMTKFVHGE